MSSLKNRSAGLLKRLEVNVGDSELSPTGDNRWVNVDMMPVPKEKRTWTTWDFFTYWLCDSYGPGQLQNAGALIATGLSWKSVVITVLVGNILIAAVMTGNGYVGAKLHTAFSVNARASFGFRFSYFAVVSRLILGTFWFGTNSYTGALGVYLMLKGIWPSVANIPNHIPESMGITSVLMMCYVIYFCIQAPLCLLSPWHLRWMFRAKAVLGPAGGLALMGYYAHKAIQIKGSGDILYGGEASLTGASYAWVWLSALNAALGSFSTLSVNIADFTRYAKGPNATYIQLLCIPFFFVVFNMMGVVITSGAYIVLGTLIWNPLTLMATWTSRPALFFGGFSFMLSTLGSNVSSNLLSAANDWTVLFPRYMNLRRGSLLTSVLACWCLVPWKILQSGATLLNFMGSYTIITAPIASILVTDFFLVKRGKIDVPAMFDPNGRYKYWHGTNWRAAVTILLTVVPLFPGFINAINPDIAVPIGMSHFFALSWIYGTFGACLFYTGLSYAFPPTETFVEFSVYDVEHAEQDVQDSPDGTSYVNAFDGAREEEDMSDEKKAYGEVSVQPVKDL